VGRELQIFAFLAAVKIESKSESSHVSPMEDVVKAAARAGAASNTKIGLCISAAIVEPCTMTMHA
jgi:hypothetical protein